MPKKGEVDEIFEALVEACGGRLEELTRNERGKYNAAAAQLRELASPPDRAEILRRARQYRYHHADWTLTPLALVSHWSEFASTRQEIRDQRIEHRDGVEADVLGVDQASLAREMDEEHAELVPLDAERLAELRQHMRGIGRTMD